LILSFLAFAFDGGYFYQQKRRMQTAADSAALAGALEIKKKNIIATDPEVENVARQDAAKNGFTHGSNGINVAIRPPTAGNYAGNNQYVEAFITQQHNSFFASLFNLLTPGGGFNQANIRTRAVAGTTTDTACIYVLHPNAPEAFEISSNTTVNAGCGVQVNSNNSRALSITSASHLNSTDINIKGNYESLSGSTVSPMPDTDQLVIPDPLGWLQPPTWSGCNYTNVTVDLPEPTSTITLNPGVYCGGIVVKKGTVTLSPGQYIMVGTSDRGGIDVGGSDARLQGDGVFLYNGGLNNCSSGPEKCRIYFRSGSTVRLSAMQTGYYAGIAIFQERALLDNEKMEVRFESGSHVSIHGAIYVPYHKYVHHSDTSGLSAADWSAVVARTMEVSSNSTVAINFKLNTTVPNPLRRIALVE
jgi:hypothetical protein